MKINHLFEAIEIDSLDPRRFSKQLVDAWRNVRFSAPVAGYEGSDAIGAVLLGSDNFAWTSSGWFDANLITFPRDLHPRTTAEIRALLERMLDCRRDPDTIKYLRHAVSDQLLARAFARRAPVWRTSLDKLAMVLEHLQSERPQIADALLAGRLWEVARHAGNAEELTGEQINTIGWMYILWALFDLQVIAYRLFHAEWNALDGGMESPEYWTLESLEKVAKTLSRLAQKTKESFSSGSRIAELDPELKAFIKRNRLLTKASRTAARLGINRQALETGAFDKKELELYLRWLQKRLQKILKWLGKRSYRPRLSMIGYGHHARASDARYVPKQIRESGGKSLEIKDSAATFRFSVPAVSALLYAVETVVEQVGALPSPAWVGIGPDRPSASTKPLFSTRQKSKIAAALFTIYRDLFVRPTKNGRDGVVKSEYEQLAKDAQAAIDNNRPDPGLEPLHPKEGAPPMKPLLSGVPARRQLALGARDPGSYEKDIQEPGIWTPKRVSAEHKAGTAAIRDLRKNPRARRHFRDRAQAFDEEFGGLNRTMQPGNDPKG